MQFRNMWIVLIWAILAVPFARCSEVIKFENQGLQKQLASGKDRMDQLQSMSKMPHRNECWKSVLRELETGCSILTEEVQTKLAFSFTSCFNEMLGLPGLMCEKSTPIKDCIRALDPNSMNTFRDYFLHTQDMCFYLQHELWQEETEKAVNKLTDVTIGVTKNMEEAKVAQAQILVSQQESLLVQSNLKKDNNALYHAILRVKEVFDDFKHSAEEHRLIFIEIFEKLTKMQILVSWIQGEMSLLDTMGFYFACLLFGLLSTATKRTRHARFWIVMLFIFCLILERATYGYFSDVDEPVEPEDIQYYIWFVRRGGVFFGIIILVVAAANYRDLQVMNSHMLTEISLQMLQITEFMDAFKNKQLPNFMNGAIKKKEKDDDSYSSHSSRSGSSDSFSNYSTDSENDNEIDLIAEMNEELATIEANGFLQNHPPMESSTPNGTPARRYNLRARKPAPLNHDAVKNERTSDFARAVKLSLKMSRSIPLHHYSSDDDLVDDLVD